MKNVTINGKIHEKDVEQAIKLKNGSLVLHYNKLGTVLAAFIVTSFRDDKRRYAESYTAGYCSLINLDTGYIEFEERCSRSTTVARVLSHLNHNDYKAKEAIKEGQYLEVYASGDYKMDLIFERR